MVESIIVNKLDDKVWNLNEASNMDAYLVAGSKKAVLIDALCNESDLVEKVRSLTSMPVDVLLTHGHGDHAGAAIKDLHRMGCDMYLNEKDYYMLSRDFDLSWFKPLNPGMIFDYGEYKFEVINMAGHTPGQMVFLDREKQLLFSGDGTGMGVFWMQLPDSLPLRTLYRNLENLYEQVKAMKNLKLHPGHRHQAPVQLGLEFLKDTIYATDKIISGQWAGEDRIQDFQGRIIQCKTVAYKLITDYRYRTDNI
jgi:glyoxylase-like metal-dependent hydrolase (beta-lactamase superfamily II)